MEHSRLIDFIKSAASVTSSSTPGLLSAKDSNKVKSSSPTSSSNLGSRTLFEDIAVASKGKIGATLQPNSKCVVADMMAGVGPFAVPLAMTPNSTIVVYANGKLTILGVICCQKPLSNRSFIDCYSFIFIELLHRFESVVISILEGQRIQQ